MGFSSPFRSCDKRAPMAFVETSHATINGCENPGKLIKVLYLKCVLTLQKPSVVLPFM